ncbi:hypothetical protein NL108_016052 [Boleophthalmus pectinirostris]|nr:hypothetical protein NL108_016052 [Boleophthalmus pectinirostris]
MEEHLTVGPMNGKFTFHKRPDGTINKGKVICLLCKKEFAYHRSNSSLAYHINAKHPAASVATANVSSEHISNLASQSKALRQTTLEENTTRLSKSATDRLTNVLAKWIAMNCWPINIVEGEGLSEVLQTASNDPSYKPPCRTTVTTKISKMYDSEKKNKLEILVEDSPNCVAITGDHWTSVGNHSYLGVTGVPDCLAISLTGKGGATSGSMGGRVLSASIHSHRDTKLPELCCRVKPSLSWRIISPLKNYPNVSRTCSHQDLV